MNYCRICGTETEFVSMDIKIENGKNCLIKCLNCQSIFSQYQTPSFELQIIYDGLFDSGEYEQHRNEFSKLISGESTYFPYRKFLFNQVRRKLSGDFIVEIGGGVGAFGLYVTKKGYYYKNFDISPIAINYVNALGLSGIVFDPENLSTLDFDDANLVVMWEVIEHIWDVAGYLRKIYENLSSNGYLLLSTPNIERKGYFNKLSKPSTSSPPIHINFFSEETLRNCLLAAGFRNIRFFHKRLERPQLNLKRIYYHLQIFLGIEAVKNLYCWAQKK